MSETAGVTQTDEPCRAGLLTSLRFRLLAGFGMLLICALANAAEPCPPCLDFDRLDKQIRDGSLAHREAEFQFSRVMSALDASLASDRHFSARQRVFPLRGYDLARAGAQAALGYRVAGYDYFDGNRHGGHPSVDLFIRDRNQDSHDDATGMPVIVQAMTGGVVVAAEPEWAAASHLRGGKYLWIYEPAEQLLLYYAHNRELLVTVGDRVEPGTPIATVGRSGFNAAKRRSPTHLHLTVLKVATGRPAPVNILPLLSKLRP